MLGMWCPYDYNTWTHSVHVTPACVCVVQVKQGVTSVTDELAKYDPNKKFPYEQLKGKDNCPTGVDPSNKEVGKHIVWDTHTHTHKLLLYIYLRIHTY